jgi:predicted nucleic acid-binding protein
MSLRPATLAHAGPVLVDSGPLIALFNGADRWHAPVLDWLRAHPAATLFSTWCVATEVCALLARRIHNDCALDFLRWVQRGGLSAGPRDRRQPDRGAAHQRALRQPALRPG